MPLFGLKKKQEETHISYSANSAYFAIATIAGVLVEVLAMLMLVKSANKTRGWFSV